MENAPAELSNQMLQNKIRNKKDLYEYMSVHLNIWLPQPQYCRLSFLQSILQDKKKYLKSSEVKIQNIKDGWNEFAIKNIWQYIKDDIQLQEYLPWEEMKEGRYPDKQFVWGVAFTIKPQWANQYYNLCVKERNKVNLNPFQKKTIIVSDLWQQKLAEHEFISKSKSSKKQSIIIEQEVKPYKKRDSKNKVIVKLYSNQFEKNQNQSNIVEQPQSIVPSRFNFSSSKNNENQQNQPSIFENQEKKQSSSKFNFNQNKEKEFKLFDNSQIQNQSHINMESLQISNSQKQIVPESQMKTGPSKKRRPEQFRENQGEEDEFTTLNNFDFLVEKNENEQAKTSPHKSAKKHKVKEEKKE